MRLYEREKFMSDKRKQVDPIPDEFTSYKEAAELWDTHDTTDYPDSFEPVSVEAEFRRRRYEVEIDEETMKVLSAFRMRTLAAHLVLLFGGG